MMKRTLLTMAAVAAIAAPASLAPALFTPANAQASLNIGLSLPAPVYPVPSYGYGSVGGPVYAWGGGWNRGWERHAWREHHDWDRGRRWEHHDERGHWR